MRRIRLTRAEAAGLAFGVYAFLVVLEALASDGVVRWLQTPSVRLAGMFLGAPVAADPGGGFVLAHPAMEVTVTRACSGLGFLALGCAWLAWHVLAGTAGRRLWLELGAGFAAMFLFTTLVNAIRITSSIQADLHLSFLMHGTAAAALHAVVGVATFLPALIALHLFAERRYAHAD